MYLQTFRKEIVLSILSSIKLIRIKKTRNGKKKKTWRSKLHLNRGELIIILWHVDPVSVLHAKLQVWWNNLISKFNQLQWYFTVGITNWTAEARGRGRRGNSTKFLGKYAQVFKSRGSGTCFLALNWSLGNKFLGTNFH